MMKKKVIFVLAFFFLIVFFIKNATKQTIEFPIIKFQNYAYTYGIHYSQKQNSYVLTGLIKNIKLNDKQIMLTIAINENDLKFPWGGTKITYQNPMLILIQKTENQTEHQWRDDYNHDTLKNFLLPTTPISIVVNYQLDSQTITGVSKVIIHSYLQNSIN